MATYVVGAVLAVALFFAVRHVYNNFRTGHNDCCSSSECNCGCSGCHSHTNPKEISRA